MTAAAFAAGRAVVPGARFAPSRAAKADRCTTSRCRRRARSRACSTACAFATRSPRSTTARALRGRALVQELAYGTLRHWGTLDAIAGVLVRKPIADPLLRSLVAVALYQLDHTRAPAFAVVDRAVFAAGALVRPGAKALVNALLRRYLRERTTIGEAVRPTTSRAGPIRAGGSSACGATIPSDWEAILAAGNARPPLTLRVNRRVTDARSAARRVRGARASTAHAGRARPA